MRGYSTELRHDHGDDNPHHMLDFTDPVTGDHELIGEACDAEKAHFLVTAANAFGSGAQDILDKIAEWHHARNLVEGSKPKDQLAKLFEEGGELAGAIARGKLPETKDGIGDMVVVLVLLALQHGTTLTECAAHAYEEIKDRKGRMVDGCFVKENE
jgi:NTP pyrophosphatase (non-canonical NTP hydrolase)